MSDPVKSNPVVIPDETYRRVLPDGGEIHVFPILFGARLGITQAGNPHGGYNDLW